MRAGVSHATISRLERGHIGTLSLDAVRAIGAALDIRLEIVPRWRGGELDRLMNARHSAMHEAVAAWFRHSWPSWTLVPEVSFSIYGERGVVDVLAWHERSRSLLVIELKTELVDVQEMLGTIDRKRRLASQIVVERNWVPARIGVWVVMASSDMNRRHVARHELTLRAVLPGDRRSVRQWLLEPAGPVAALSFFATAHPGNTRGSLGPVQRVGRARGARTRA